MKTLLGLLTILIYNVVIAIGALVLFGGREWDILGAVGVGLLVIVTFTVVYETVFHSGQYE